MAHERVDTRSSMSRMPGATGLQIAQRFLPSGPVVVFVTAFNQSATDAFDVLAVDYVLKPFSDERFYSALDRAKTRARERRLAELASQLATVSNELHRPVADRRGADDAAGVQAGGSVGDRAGLGHRVGGGRGLLRAGCTRPAPATSSAPR